MVTASLIWNSLYSSCRLLWNRLLMLVFLRKRVNSVPVLNYAVDMDSDGRSTSSLFSSLSHQAVCFSIISPNSFIQTLIHSLQLFVSFHLNPFDSSCVHRHVNVAHLEPMARSEHKAKQSQLMYQACASKAVERWNGIFIHFRLFFDELSASLNWPVTVFFCRLVWKSLLMLVFWCKRLNLNALYIITHTKHNWYRSRRDQLFLHSPLFFHQAVSLLLDHFSQMLSYTCSGSHSLPVSKQKTEWKQTTNTYLAWHNRHEFRYYISDNCWSNIWIHVYCVMLHKYL